MGDQGRWFKLWITADDDPAMAVMPIAEYGRWCKFGTYTKAHGTDGVIEINGPPPGVIHPLQGKFQVESFDAVLKSIKNFPTCEISTVSSETNGTVSYSIKWRNWWKYQGDFSTHRVQKFRDAQRRNETPKKRREEKRREETRREEKILGGTPLSPLASGAESFEAFWALYPKRIGKGAAAKVWERLKPNNGLSEKIMAALSAQLKTAQWQRENGRFIPNPATWLNQRRWEDDLFPMRSAAQRLWQEGEEEEASEREKGAGGPAGRVPVG